MGDLLVDEFYAARNLLYLGAHQQALEALAGHTHLSAEREAEKRSLQYRALLAQGNAQAVLDAVPAGASEPAQQVLRQLALVVRAGAALADEDRARAAAQVEALAGSGAVLGGSLAAVAAQLLLAVGDTEAALRILALYPRNVECVCTMAAAYLGINRRDLAQKVVAQTREWCEDAPVAQLAEAWTGLAAAGAKRAEALYIYEELAQASPHARLQMPLAVCRMHMGQFPEAHALLLEALEKDPQAPDVLANLVVCASHAALPADARSEHLAQLRLAAPAHPLVAELDAKSAEFDAAAAKLA
ncbi:hypothetical protein IWQ56_000616 [Coemansia nantahalensis]|uniref:Uncharacterized protein n=1 Tax=Coemansia nantahalensis TaxID=2789366 RepID=A0ACC1JL70_9FUNG|nr:hypothetical protein IWQ57_005985 [Coemansia nantahalensis]KAJ2774350.1 hypothetical protein IWQ56_000616 [Coemansia nantahalensis]